MQIEYESLTGCAGTGSVTEQEPIYYWIRSNLQKGGIESQIRKLRDLLAVVGEQWLLENPQRLNEVAAAIECEGTEHKFTRNKA